MKSISILSIVLLLSTPAFSQMHVKKPNFTSFNTDKVYRTPTLAENSSAEAKKHPEYGVQPYNAQCTECVELLDKRTIDSRQFINPNYEGQTYSQKSYFPLHYKKAEGDVWHTIDKRLRPDANHPGVYTAPNQPVPTKLDMNKKTSSVAERGFEFEFNKNLQLYYFDDNTLYTQKESADYTHYTVGQEGLNVKNMWSGIDMEQIFTTGEIKTNFVIPAPMAFPISHGFMVIEDHFSLPNGYTIEETQDGGYTPGVGYRGDYLIRNKKGDTLIVMEKPIYLDAKAFGMHGNYRLLQTGNDYALQVLIPVEWPS